jgi:hypothetical protein
MKSLHKLLPFVLLILAIAGFYYVAKTVKSYTATARYEECIALTPSDPAKALEQAKIWEQKNAISPFARHCEALANYHLKNYLQAAEMLAALAKEVASSNPTLSSTLILQAQSAYNAAGKPDLAKGLLVEFPKEKQKKQ